MREFLFPRSVWTTASAWLDVRYFFFHQVLRVAVHGLFAVEMTDWTFARTTSLLGPSPPAASTVWWADATLVIASMALLDFIAFGIHYLQHRVPLLWRFHKVHHSARVMHPLTNYREHPFDNVFYSLGLGAGAGMFAAVVTSQLGYTPSEPTILGVGVSVVAFNSLGYHLRHSHIWLRWPGALAYFFGCPAHHQVHHSYHPAHIDKNFAFVFPLWDVIFGTFCLPQTNVDVKFGLDEHQADEFRTCLDLYLLPIRQLMGLPAGKRKANA